MSLFRFSFLAVCSLLLLLPLQSSAAATADQAAEIYDAMDDLRTSESALASSFLTSIFHLEALVARKPDIGSVRDSSEKLVAAFDAYEKAAATVRSRLVRDSAQLATWDGRESLADDVSEENLKQMGSFVTAYSDLVASIAEAPFSVYANEGWANSGIAAGPDDLLFVIPEGSWTVSQMNWPTTDWKGYQAERDSAYAINPSVPLGALLYRVRGSSNQNGFAFDENGKGRTDAAGRLEFSINDQDRTNNSGQMDLNIFKVSGQKLAALVTALKSVGSKK